MGCRKTGPFCIMQLELRLVISNMRSCGSCNSHVCVRMTFDLHTQEHLHLLLRQTLRSLPHSWMGILEIFACTTEEALCCSIHHMRTGHT